MTPVLLLGIYLPKRYDSMNMNPLTDEYIKKKWYYSAIKNHEIMSYAPTQLDVEIIILSEVSQKKKDKYHMVSLICDLSISKYESKI